MRIGIGRSVSTILRSASSMRSSSSPVTFGAPAVRISLPPSASTSEARNDDPAAPRPPPRPRSRGDGAPRRPRPGRCCSISASVPSKWMNAIVTGRCSEVPPPARTCARTAVDRQRASVSAGIFGRGTSGNLSVCPGGSRRRSSPGPLASPRHRLGRSAAVSGLTMISPASAACSIATRRLQPGPTGRNSKWDVPTAKKWKQPGMHALRHPQRDLRPGDFDPADVAQHPAHQDGRATGARGVTLALEPQQQRVAAELEQAAAVVVGDEQDRLETAPDRLGDLLGALAALAGEPFGQLREPGDVHEDGGAVRGPASAGRIVDADAAGGSGPRTEPRVRRRARGPARSARSGSVAPGAFREPASAESRRRASEAW